MRDLTLRRITANRITIYRRSHRPRLFCVDDTDSKAPMAGEAEKNGRLTDKSSTLDFGKREEAVKLPPPPEKPLPGDCCGSGCVRCVWDVYYEELEDYNKLLSESKGKSDSDSK
ncbi:hypothetical protein U1Q18_011599 [Sarracenia purpurea var. burkii]